MRVVTRALPVTILLVASTFIGVQAQSLKDHLQKGDRFYERKDYKNAIAHYVQALAVDPDDAVTTYRTGLSYYHNGEFDQAITFLENAYQSKPDIDPDIHYYLGVAYQHEHAFEKARGHFELVRKTHKRLAPVATQKIRQCMEADSLMKIPINGKVEALGAEINSSFSEFAALISGDGNTLLFTSNRSADDYQIKSRTNDENVFISHRNSGSWSTPQKIGEPVNVSLNEAATFVSADGKTLLLYYEDGGGDIYSSSLDNGQWSKPVALNRFVNHPQYRESSACISPDGKRLFFSSNRPGGRGGYDLYVCELGANGQWGRPSNLGSSINTRGDEQWPFLHADGGTLYFSSNGWATLGEADIFKAQLKNGKWTRLQNLGYPINTSAEEGHFVLSEDSVRGYFNSLRNARATGSDIFTVEFSSPSTVNGSSPLSASAKKDVVTILRGTVIDAQKTTPLQATIRLVDNADKHTVVELDTDGSGNFEVIIPHGGNYGLTTETPDYLFNSMNFDVPAFESYHEIDTHILMVKAEVGSKVILKNIFFDVGDAELKVESLSELENLRNLLVRNPRLRIQINGHTDNVGAADANLTLSLKRAQSVVSYLVRQGISSDRLQAKGFGATQPLVSNDDEQEGRQLNRRTEFEIVE